MTQMPNGVVRKLDEALGAQVVEPWGSLTWLSNRRLTGAVGTTVGRVVIKRGQQNPRHSHPNTEEVLYLLAGQLEHSLGDDKVILNAGDTLLVPAGVVHNARSIGEVDADMIVAYNTAERSFVPEQ